MSKLALFCCCVVLVLLALRLPRLGKRALILVLFVRLFDLRLFGFVCSSSSWCLGRAAICDCGTPWTFLLPFFIYSSVVCHVHIGLFGLNTDISAVQLHIYQYTAV